MFSVNDIVYLKADASSGLLRQWKLIAVIIENKRYLIREVCGNNKRSAEHDELVSFSGAVMLIRKSGRKDTTLNPA